MKKERTYFYNSTEKELIAIIHTNISLLASENVLSKERKEEIEYSIQNIQNELNLRQSAHSTKIVKALSLITIGLTAITVVLSIYVFYYSSQSSILDMQMKIKEIQLLDQILKQAERID